MTEQKSTAEIALIEVTKAKAAFDDILSKCEMPNKIYNKFISSCIIVFKQLQTHNINLSLGDEDQITGNISFIQRILSINKVNLRHLSETQDLKTLNLTEEETNTCNDYLRVEHDIKKSIDIMLLSFDTLNSLFQVFEPKFKITVESDEPGHLLFTANSAKYFNLLTDNGTGFSRFGIQLGSFAPKKD